MSDDQIRVEFERAFPTPENVYWNSTNGFYDSLPKYRFDSDAHQARYQGFKAAHARYAGGGEAVPFDDWPEYSEQGMGCGLEDRGITDRYEAMRYGWDEAIDRVAERLEGYTHPGPAVPEYAYSTIKEFEQIVGYQVNEAFRTGFDMARITEQQFAILTASKEGK